MKLRNLNAFFGEINKIANETLNRVYDEEYEVNGQCVKLPQPERFSTVEIILLCGVK